MEMRFVRIASPRSYPPFLHIVLCLSAFRADCIQTAGRKGFPVETFASARFVRIASVPPANPSGRHPALPQRVSCGLHHASLGRRLRDLGLCLSAFRADCIGAGERESDGGVVFASARFVRIASWSWWTSSSRWGFASARFVRIASLSLV